ncbi:MAG: hypothetical protein K1X50_10625, partial [Candidatus Promineofilum sp.]|nr:hypothetical protein [Promineifilum sp.]
ALACRPEYDRVDFLIYMSAANYKRDRRANGREYLLDRLARIKPHWCVQQPHDKHQKTFLLGSKWNGFGKWKHDLAFEPVTTERGRAYLNLINLTADERDQAQQPPLVA